MQTSHLLIKLGLVALVVASPACTNVGTVSTGTSSATKASTTSASTVVTSDNANYKISNVVVTTAAAANQGKTQVYFDPSLSETPLTSVCTAAATGLYDCVCTFEWSEINQATSQRVTIPRSVTTKVTNVQSYLVECGVPTVFSTEVSSEQSIQVKVKAANTSAVRMVAYSYTKNADDGVADFRSQEGLAFLNIHRYTCHEAEATPYPIGISSAALQVTAGSPQPFTKNMILANDFCVGGSAEDATTCAKSVPTGISARANYFNLLVPSNQRGAIVSQNNLYRCPKVKESLAGASTVGTQGSFWPLDTQFALARNSSTDFSVPVEGPSLLGSSSQSSSAPTQCVSSPNPSAAPGTADPTRISSRCLGWAMTPAADGTCGSFKDSQGRIRQTFRLRKYIALYPLRFDNKGAAVTNRNYAADVIYVADRRVTGTDPLKPDSMLGAKPCNFAYFDRHAVAGKSGADLAGSAQDKDGDASVVDDNAVLNSGWDARMNSAVGGSLTGLRPAYVATNDLGWDGKNADGNVFPNRDSPTANSCSAIMHIPSYDTNTDEVVQVALGTTHSTNTSSFTLKDGSTISLSSVHIRPGRPWAPHYEEDKSFEACAPESDTLQDPPLHFARDTSGNVAYCAAVYPTQNEAFLDLEPRPLASPNALPGGVSYALIGGVVPFTSPVVKNSISPQCTATLPLKDSSQWENIRICDRALGSCNAALSTCTCNTVTHPNDFLVDTGPTSNGGAVSNLFSNRTCDRTALDPGIGQWKRFPLQAPPGDIESMLASDPSYRCTLTSGNKKGKNTPTDGCCNAQFVWLTTGTYRGDKRDTAHFEPSTASSGSSSLRSCGVPNY